MEKRYLQFSQYLKERYRQKVWKIPVDAGFTCPNRDGKLGQGGCIFCHNEAFSVLDKRPAMDQIKDHIRRIRNSRHVDAFIVYFQSFTNTYAPLEQLKALWDESAALPEVVALAIGTRPDCIDDGILKLLASYQPDVDIWLEIGVQTIHDHTLAAINRGHGYECSRIAIEKAAAMGINVSAHLIFGLPGETREMMIETVETVARLPIKGVKFHPLQVYKETRLAELYEAGQLQVMTREPYLQLLCDAIERMPSHVVMQRLTAEADLDKLLTPRWCVEKMAALNRIDAILEQRGSKQGSRLQH